MRPISGISWRRCVRRGRRLTLTAALTLLALGALARPALADTRTATANDGPDPGVTFDIAQVHVEANRDAGTFSLAASFHAPVPQTPPAGGSHYMVVWVNDAPAGECLIGGGLQGKVGDVSVNIEPSVDPSGLRATVHTRYRQEYNPVPVQVSADRKQLSLSFSDDLIKQSNHRCLAAAGSGQASYDPSQAGGGSTYDSVAEVWFDGQGPPGAGGACTTPALLLSGAQSVAHGTIGPVNVTASNSHGVEYGGGALLTMADDAQTGKVFYRRTFTAGDDDTLRDGDPVEFFIDLDPERTPAIVTLTWKQAPLLGDPIGCTARMPVASIRGSRPRFYVRGGGVGELIQRGRRCWEVRGTRVVVTVSAGRRAARFIRTNGCGLFRGPGRTVGKLHVRRTAYGTLSFTSRGRGRARLMVRISRRVTLRRTVITRVRSRPDRRIFEGSDAFFNYCIKRNKELFSYRVRLYCIKPGSYSKAVLFR
jgi:hypothetical protein